MSSVRSEMEILRRSQKEVLEIKNTVIEMKNAFDKLISNVNMARGRI